MTQKGAKPKMKSTKKKLDAILLDPFDEKTNFRLEEEVKRLLAKQAKFFKISRNELMRQVLTDFVLYQEDARQFGRNNFFKIEQALSRWIIERNELEYKNLSQALFAFSAEVESEVKFGNTSLPLVIVYGGEDKKAIVLGTRSDYKQDKTIELSQTGMEVNNFLFFFFNRKTMIQKLDEQFLKLGLNACEK